jgi:hypothetical protein
MEQLTSSSIWSSQDPGKALCHELHHLIDLISNKQWNNFFLPKHRSGLAQQLSSGDDGKAPRTKDNSWLLFSRREIDKVIFLRSLSGTHCLPHDRCSCISKAELDSVWIIFFFFHSFSGIVLSKSHQNRREKWALELRREPRPNFLPLTSLVYLFRAAMHGDCFGEVLFPCFLSGSCLT